MKILAISGSLRAASLNSMLLRVLARVAPAGVEVTLYPDLGRLPLFNPDLADGPPAIVRALEQAILDADALVIASPEYAHGVTGAIKNGLDWMVGNESFIDKPVALFNASPRATHAHAALRETVSVMSAPVVDAACIVVPLVGANLDEQALEHDTAMVAALRGALLALREHVGAVAADATPQ
ncbi:NADPH-dependent FMN reductase [Rugamonas apoptosis]|uniref:NAD(P)H-dependent oxidoreductase n=1 Tax=Rugamonas apoptosis TaxID=2758570 RepID=A0A7W2ILG0_9BURK|nr:NADPH-dependent FMN reductase [Rugamonas apoptosis]MBA5688411.1 NAD(P)H-dependent oxidoreductase [Rugamonas apoptosis]